MFSSFWKYCKQTFYSKIKSSLKFKKIKNILMNENFINMHQYSNQFNQAMCTLGLCYWQQNQYIFLSIMMNKNHFSPSSTCKNIEMHKASSLIFYQNQKQPANSHIFNIKNSQEFPTNKVHTMYRHSSQDDLKDFKKSQPLHINLKTQNMTRPQNQYFVKRTNNQPNQGLAPNKKIQKNINLHQIKFKNLKESSNSAGSGNQKTFLKETSSTQSAENLKLNFKGPPPPILMRNKINKKLKSICSQYNMMKIPTSRTKLKRQNFKFIMKLGQGKFGKVFLVKQIHTGLVLAMKIVQKKKIIKENLLQQFIREIKIQSYLNHPNIISLYGFFHDETHFYTLMELGCDGQLYSLMCSNKEKSLNEQTISFIIKNLLQAIDYMHNRKILHRDIKPQNIVLIMGNLKICDFGWAANKIHHAELRTTICGTPLYLSPELLNGNKYDQKVDIWATGILAYQLMVGCSPFQILQQHDLHKIINQKILFPQEKGLSQQFQHFILSMLEKNPIERMNSQKLLNEEFIKKYSEFETCQQLCK